MASEIENKIINNDQILPFTNIHIFHKHQRNFINTGGWHAFPCVIPPTTDLTISYLLKSVWTPPYNISNSLVRSEVMGDTLKITFHPPKDLHDPLHTPLTSKIILEFPSGLSCGLLASKARFCVMWMNLHSVPWECHAKPDRQFSAKIYLIHSVTFLVA